jgi:hypothetical protein
MTLNQLVIALIINGFTSLITIVLGGMVQNTLQRQHQKPTEHY